ALVHARARGAALEAGRGALPGEGLAQQLDAEIAGHHQRIRVGELQRGAEALLVLGVIDPARVPHVAPLPAQLAQHLGTADALAALRAVVGVPEPDNATAEPVAAWVAARIATRGDLHRALAGVVDPHAGNVGGGRLPGGPACKHNGRRDDAAGATEKSSHTRKIHRQTLSWSQSGPGPLAGCNLDWEKMRQRRNPRQILACSRGSILNSRPDISL